MTDQTDVDTAVAEQPADQGPTRGQRIDELVTAIPRCTKALDRTAAEFERIRKERSDYAAELATILGSTGAAAAMLGITGREFAALRGRKP